MRDKTEPADHESGFSLIEVIVALLIFAVLAGIVGMNVRQAVQATRLDAAQSAVLQIVRTTRAQSTFLGEFVPFELARRGHPHEREAQTIFFDPSAGSHAHGICSATEGYILFDGRRFDFSIANYSCVVTYRA
ncbi:MAG: prepilin-type N-terminal cleavage/methylation domain-containing protein [Pseudomonadota bacterium]